MVQEEAIASWIEVLDEKKNIIKDKTVQMESLEKELLTATENVTKLTDQNEKVTNEMKYHKSQSDTLGK